MNARILIAIVVSLFVCQQVHAQDEPVMPEATELEGTWELVSLLKNGVQLGVGGYSPWRFEGNRVSTAITAVIGDCWGGKGKEIIFNDTGTFSLNPSAMPAEIDGLFNAPGIYEVDGRELRICIRVPIFVPATRPPPDRFESTEDYPTALWVLRRVDDE